MRIAHYMTDLWKAGGVAAYVRRVAQGLRAAGHEVLFFDQRRFAPRGDAASAAPADGPVRYVEDDAGLLAAAAEAGADLLHVHTHVQGAGGSPVPVVRTLHNHEPYCPSGTRFLGSTGRACDRAYGLLGCAWGHLAHRCGSVRPASLLAGFSRTRAERRELPRVPVIAVSEFLRGQMLANGYPPDRLYALPLFAPCPGDPTPPPADGPARFVFLGRITPLKGVDWLLRAAARVDERRAGPVRVDVAGEGNPRDEAAARRLAADLGLGGRVTFHGWLAPGRVDDLLRAARALVFPSLWHEPAGLGVLEAMARARATIVSDVGGTPELVRPAGPADPAADGAEGATGLLVPAGDDAALASAIRRLAGDRALAETLGAAGRRLWAERFTPAHHLAGLTELYRRYARPAAGSPAVFEDRPTSRV